MNLKRKIKNCKRHKRNKKLSIFAEAMFNTSWKTSEYNFFVHPLIFEIIRFNHFEEMCNKLKPSEFIDNPFSYVLDTESLYPRFFLLDNDNQILTVPDDIMEFYKDNPAKWLKEWCGIPKLCEPFEYGIDKTILTTSPIPPKPSVSIKEI